MKRISRLLFFGLLVPAAFLVGGWQGWAWWSWATAPASSTSDAASAAPPPDGTPGDANPSVLVEIEPGTAAQQIGQDLETLGLIRSARAWNAWGRWLSFRDADGSFQAGVYELSPNLSLQAIAETVWNGDVVQQQFVIPEGWTLGQMAEYFESQGFFPADAFLAVTRDIPRDRFPWLPADLPLLEGFLYPDTYQLPTGSFTPEQVRDTMLSRFEEVALPLWERGRNDTDLTLVEWVALASIVEKEAVIPEERPLIAGVFANRLERGQRLEADPTVEYGLNIRQTADRPLTFDQVRTPSPYNTYLNPGLPPTPIAAPGEASLAAALDPEPTEYLFFVARYDGTHAFSRTLAEHEAATRRIRQEREAQQARDGQS